MSSLTVPGMARPHRWLRAHPVAADALLALAVYAIVLIGSFAGRGRAAHAPGPWFLLLCALACGALTARRRYPRTVLGVTSALTLAEIVADRGGSPRTQIATAVFVALYTIASRTERAAAWRFAVATVAVLTCAAMLFGVPPWYSPENLGLFTWTALAGALGDAVRSRRAYVAAIEERAVRAERTREEEARRRVAEERLRIARELHDVVAHHIALVNVQAGVASHIMDSRPDQAKQALAHVREASRSALSELRATVGLLRQYGDPEAPTEPAPGLGVLGRLVDGFARVGLEVKVIGGPGEALPAAVDLAAYRVVQEALTNVHKHAGPGARAEVTLARGPDALAVTVLDDGGGGPPAPSPSPEGGHGLLGMRERVTALGGTCAAAPREDAQGFRVHATLPLRGRP
ncbi:two-component sensor histidine kinase [Streptosporangium nondiastaticum]|uniref:histidine kinase n=1 Tax=Streptosporangium nondiastaticum TaxID=35764 RepID=A0A9X7JQU0_9ACTN|nr:histidine kinase [Streptosporangium nondiastaticum]PSJ28033.1 two-component sensor histidine kinase [Streptosporangium nondiastaticum]